VGRAGRPAGLEPAEAFGRRLAVVAHTQHAEQATRLAVLGDGAAWIWNLADEHFPAAVQIVDWFHASERVWELGRARFGPETPETAAWVEAHLARLAPQRRRWPPSGPGCRCGARRRASGIPR